MKEKVKETNVPLTMYINDVLDGTISDDQDVQRKFCSDKSFVNGIGVTVLTGDYLPPIVLCEVPIGDDVAQTYIVDGGQRTAALIEIKSGRHKFTSTTEDGDIEYQSKKVDENGKVCKDDDGQVQWEKKTYNIVGKTYNDFPKELKDRFDKYLVKIATHPQCTVEESSKYVRRYNNHKGMNPAQKAFTYLSHYGRKAKNIAGSGFFMNCIKPSKTEPKKGTYEKAVCESVMTTFHLDDWKKSPKAMTEYLNEHSSDEEFARVKDNFETLEFICDDKYQDIFVMKNVPVWLAVFNEFRKLHIEDAVFCEFINRFTQYLYGIVVDQYGYSFANLDEMRNTKDTVVMVNKVKVLTYLMKDYFKQYITDEKEMNVECMDYGDKEPEIEDIDVLEFVKENVSDSVTQDDIDDYYSMLDAYHIDKTSRLLDWQNEPSLLAVIAYSFKADIDLDDWIIEYFKRNKMYFVNQKKNYDFMLKDLHEYTQLANQVAV